MNTCKKHPNTETIGKKRPRCKICAEEKYNTAYKKFVTRTQEQVFKENKDIIVKKFNEGTIKDDGHMFYITNSITLRSHTRKLEKQWIQVEMKEFSVQSISYWLKHGYKPKTFHYSFCTEPHCVNPDHIKESNSWYNARSFATTCTKGHDLSDDQSYIEYSAPNGKVYKKCKVCKNAARRALNERNRTAAEHSDRVEQTWSQTVAQ